MKVVGSGVDASATGAGKTVTSGRALAHRASTTRRLRTLIVAEGRLLGQWRDELARGAPGRGLPALAPNVDVLVLDDRRPIAAQIRAFDRATGDRAGVVLCPNGALDRFAGQLEAIPWHLPDRRRGAALRQRGHARPLGAQARPAQRGGRLLAAHRHPARQNRRAPRRAGRARARR
jgi:hypothetical protein